MALNIGLVASLVILQDWKEMWETAGEASSTKAYIYQMMRCAFPLTLNGLYTEKRKCS
jgi:hypothetical protein